MIEVDAEQGKKIWELIADEGLTPDEAVRKVLMGETEGFRSKFSFPTYALEESPDATKPRKANTIPATKRKLDAWLEEAQPDVIREHRFHPTRKWRFDWFLPSHNIAVEYEGFMTKGANVGHASIAGIMRDVEKYNEAQAMGIRVFRASAENVRTGAFFDLMTRALKED